MPGVRRGVRAGFTLAELLVVLAILAILVTIILTDQSSFNRSLTLTATAYDMALQFRAIETFGIGTRNNPGDNPNTGYGAHFDLANSANSYVVYKDNWPAPSASNCHGLPVNGASAPDAVPGDCGYSAANDTLVQTVGLNNNITIMNICLEAAQFVNYGSYGTWGAGQWACFSHWPHNVSEFDFVFSRPNPGVIMTLLQSQFPTKNEANDWAQGCIVLRSREGHLNTLGSGYVPYTHAVAVYKTGAINPNAVVTYDAGGDVTSCQ